MEQYEKWLKGKAGIGWYTGTAEGWKAALEWVLDNYPDDAIYEIIKRELGDE